MRNAPTSRDGTPSLPDLLPLDTDSDRPWLIWYADSERIELSGHVLRMWASKTAGLLASEAGDHPVVHLDLPVGWKAVTWAAGTWLAGGCVVLAPSPSSTSDPVSTASTASTACTVSVASTPADLVEDAQVQVLVPTASLAVRWQDASGHGPAPLVLDGAADLMAYPDRFTPVDVSADDPAFVQGPPFGGVGSMSRAEVVARARERSAGLHGARAVLATPGGGGMAEVLLDVLGAWAAGATAVLAAPGTGGDLAARAARQEGAVRVQA